MQRLKIALVCDWFLPRVGGVEYHMRDLAASLTARGHEVHIVNATPGSELNRGVKIHRIDVSRVPYYGIGWNHQAVGPLAQIFRRESFDVIHSHNLYGAVGLAAMYVAKQLGVPSVLTNHAYLGRGAVAFFRTLNRIYDWSSWPDVITAVSNHVADETRLAGGRDVLVLPNGVEPSEWRVGPTPDDHIRIASVMRLVRRKEPLELIRAIPRILARLPRDLRLQFTIVGDGPQRARTEREAANLGVSGHVEFLGCQARSGVGQVLSSSQIFVLPNRKESLGIAILEAGCAGLPVVAMRGSGNGMSDIIQQGHNGYLAESREHWIDSIVELVSNPALRARMAHNARKAAQRFSWANVTAQHLEIYQQARASRLSAEPARAVA